MYIYIYIYIYDTGVQVSNNTPSSNTPPEKTLGKIRFESTESGDEEQSGFCCKIVWRRLADTNNVSRRRHDCPV